MKTILKRLREVKELVNVLVSEIRKNKRSKALAISALLIVIYEAITVFYTVRAVGLFDNFMYLYKFALSYMDFRNVYTGKPNR